MVSAHGKWAKKSRPFQDGFFAGKILDWSQLKNTPPRICELGLFAPSEKAAAAMRRYIAAEFLPLDGSVNLEYSLLEMTALIKVGAKSTLTLMHDAVHSDTAFIKTQMLQTFAGVNQEGGGDAGEPCDKLSGPAEGIATVTFIGVALLLRVIATLACLIPARRAAHIDPVAALRAEYQNPRHDPFHP